MRPLKRLIQIGEAMALMRKEARPITRSENVSIAEACGRVCAEQVISQVNVPPFSRSVMDGYAVRATDTRGASKLRPVELNLNEILHAGSVPKKSLKKGKCTKIATGAMLPRGADAVVMVEDTELEGNAILVYDAVLPDQNVSKIGEDIREGSVILSKREVLNPSKLGALAAIGRDRVCVYSRPLVAVVATGNEIAKLGSKLKPGQVYNINTYTLSTLLASNGAEVRTHDVVGDSIKDLLKVLDDNRDCDIVVFSGGSSVGERDFTLDMLEQRGRVVFHGVALKPGKPTLFGVIGQQLVFGMPGNPTACLSNGFILLVPIVREIAGLPQEPPRQVTARMSKRVVSAIGRTQFLTVRLEGDVAHPAFKGSGAITSMAHADGYVVVPADVGLLDKGESVTVYLL